jgi:hypothetical protein
MARYAVLAMCLGAVIAVAAVLPAEGKRQHKPRSMTAVIAKGDLSGVIRADRLRRGKLRLVSSLHRTPQASLAHPEVTLIVLLVSKPCSVITITDALISSYSYEAKGESAYSWGRIGGSPDAFRRTRSIRVMEQAPGGEPQQALCTNEVIKEVVLR